jgi:RNA polymerase-associated protein CTR9
MVRTLDVQVNESESIGLDLDDLDVDPEDVLDLLSDSQLCPVAVWVKISAEYWKQGYLDQAEKIAQTAISRSLPFLSIKTIPHNLKSLQQTSRN